jgi:hypothetical protein
MSSEVDVKATAQLANGKASRYKELFRRYGKIALGVHLAVYASFFAGKGHFCLVEEPTTPPAADRAPVLVSQGAMWRWSPRWTCSPCCRSMASFQVCLRLC